MSFIEINSEIGELEGVILHTPGVEIESMTPSNIQEALYSDLLNLNIASKEYSNLPLLSDDALTTTLFSSFE